MKTCYNCGYDSMTVAIFQKRKIWNSEKQEFVPQDAPREYCPMYKAWGDYPANKNAIKEQVKPVDVGL